MKTNYVRSSVKHLVIIALAAFVVGAALAEEKVLFESMKFGDTVVKNVRVSSATPVSVIIHFDGGGAAIERRKLPPELAALYPYEAKAALAYEQEQEAERTERAARERSRQAENQRQFKTDLLRQRQALKERTETLEKELARLEREMAPVQRQAFRRPRSTTRAELDRMLDTNRTLVRRLEEQKHLVDQIDQRLALLP